MAKGNRSRRLQSGFAVQHLHVTASCRVCQTRGAPVVIRARWAINQASHSVEMPARPSLGAPACPGCGGRTKWSLVYGGRPDWADLYRRALRGEDVSRWHVEDEEQMMKRLEAEVLQGLPVDGVEQEGTQDGTEREGSEEGQQ